MIKRYLAAGCLFLLTHFNIFSQDLALQAPFGSFSSPATGCALTSTETVTVTIVCFGTNLPAGTTFDVTYTINGGGPVTETVTLVSTLLASSTYIHTFATDADLSVPGTYDFDANVTLTSVADINTSNDNHTNHMVTNNAASVGGTVSGGTNVCFNSNAGNVTLAGHTGTVVNWEQSIDGGFIWTNLSNTTTSQSYSNLTVATQYRAVVQNASCPAATSVATTMTIDATSVGGSITGVTSVCATANSATITSTGKTGVVIDWDSSTVATTGPFFSMAHAGNTHSFTNLSATTYYRVRVQNGSCGVVNSSVKTVTVNPASNGGNVTTSDTVCASGNAGTVSVAGQVGTVSRWELSTDGGATYPPGLFVTTSATSLNYTNLTTTTLYRVRVVSGTGGGACPFDNSDTAVITVDALSVGGTLASDALICSGLNGDTIDLSGQLGTVVDWESSIDGGAAWLPLGNITTSEVYSNVTQNTLYRALVQNGVCAGQYSDTVSLTIVPNAVGGNILGGATVCASGNAGNLTLVGFTSTVVDWQQSTDGGFTFTPIGNTTITQPYSALATTTIYQVIVGSGTCPNDTSVTATITVDQPSIGGTVTLDDTVCAGANGDTLNLAGQTGAVVQWELSTDNGTTWLTLSNTTTSQIYNNVLTTSLFRVRVQNGVCPAANSVAATITVNPQSVGGVVNSNQAGCEGANSGVFTLTGETGTIVNWEFSTDNGSTWSVIPGATTSTLNFLNFNDTTLVRANVQSGTCALDSSSYAIFTAYPKPLANFTSDTNCLNVPLNFVNTSTIPNGSIVINTWDFGDGSSAVLGSPNHLYSATGTYNVTLVAMSNFNCLDTITLTAMVNPLPDVTITTSNGILFCAEDTTTLFAVFNGNYDYDWSTGDSTFTTLIDSSQLVTLTITDTTTGCVNSTTVNVIELPSPTAYAGLDTTINLGENYQFFGTGGGTYLWSPGSTLNDSTSSSPIASPLVTTTYYMTVTNSSGCTDTDTVTVTVEEVINLVITNLITPNGDGFNDTWYIQNIELFPDNRVEIFNRYGQVIFTQDAYDNTWGGTFNGTVVPDGTYYYVVSFESSESVLKGSVNVLKNN
jgi:gliding motility-associated-like protein